MDTTLKTLKKNSKRLKIFVGTNTLTQVDQFAHANHLQFWFRLGRSFPDVDFVTMTPRRMSIDNMRNFAAKAALENNCDYLMFIDDDVLVDPFKTFPSLLEACEKYGKDVVMSETYIRGYPFEPMFFKFKNLALSPYRNFKKFIDEKTGLLDCDAVGFSCVIIKCSLLKKVSTPFFITGPMNTEDIYFCMKARLELGAENVKIAVDTKTPTGHILDAEPIHHYNRDNLIKFYEATYPNLKEEKRDRDRGTEYAAAVESIVKIRESSIKSRVRRKPNKKCD